MLLKLIVRPIRVLLRNNFSRRVIILIGGTVIGQSVGILFMPLLTRLYTPAEFGVLGLFVSTLTMLLPLAGWRFQLAIPLPSSDSDALDVTVLSIIMTAFASFLVGLFILLFRIEWISWLNAPGFGTFIWLVPIGLFCVGLYELLTYWAIRKHAFRLMSTTKVTQGFTQTLFQMGFGFLNLGALGLVVGDFLGRISGTGTLSYLVWKEQKTNFKSVSIKRIHTVMMRYKKFGLYSAPAAFLSGFTIQLPILVVSKLFHTESVGLYLLIHKLVMTPISLVVTSVGQVYLFEAANVGKSDERQKKLFWSVLRKMVLLFCPILVLMVVDTRPLFGAIFGIEWSESGAYLRALIPLYFMTAIASPLGFAVDVMEKQHLHIVREILRICLLGASAYIAATWKLRATTTLTLLSLAGALGYFMYLTISYLSISYSTTQGDPAPLEVGVGSV